MMICRKTMEACYTPGMCMPHGGCRDSQPVQIGDSASSHPNRRAALNKILTSLECTAAWLEGGCSPIHAAEEIRLNIATVKELRDES